VKIAKFALGNKTTNFGISCKLLTKKSTYKKTFFVLFPSAVFSKEITKPFRKIEIRIIDMLENVLINGCMVISNLAISLVP
jgi:hypothetical protein